MPIFCLYQNDSIRFKLSYEYINLVEYNNGKKIKITVNLSKEYSEIDKFYTSKFNNGVLDKIAKGIRK